ncbi:MAG: hypothetical protein KDE55_00610 [Novosphingobium sp.]|nr:hypothetical protein [Novosphingobium sp.]
MRILFIENREKTRFWAAIASRLEARGFSVGWAVQNPLFAKGLPGQVHVLPFPPRGTRDEPYEPARWPTLATDRGRDYFGAGHGHYTHYDRELAAVFDAFQPQLVLGEATLFHELLAVAEADARAVPYLHPAAERYPQDRFCFFEGVTQCAVGGDGHQYSQEDALDYARRVAEGREQLVYMRRRGKVGQALHKLNWAWTRGRILTGRLRGERFNTPAPARKWRMAQVVKSRLKEWQELQRPVRADERAIMYPMQMAPEANIEVWGRPYNDQIATIRRILSAAHDDVKVAVKANPKPKYEMSESLIELGRDDPRVIFLPVQLRMPEAMEQCIGAITVCGTVGFEAAFGKGRCISLRHPVITQTCPELAADTPEEAVSRLLHDPLSGIGSDETGANLLQAIARRSYKGFVSDPFSNPACLDADNIGNVAEGVAHVAALISQDGLNVRDAAE